MWRDYVGILVETFERFLGRLDLSLEFPSGEAALRLAESIKQHLGLWAVLKSKMIS